MNSPFLLFLALLFSVLNFAQEGLPTDYLSAEFHKNRRQAVRDKLPENSVAVFFANPVRNRANDVDFVYHQDPDFYYLTGYKEPNAVLVIFSENQKNPEGATYNEAIFVQKKDPNAELWTGYRLGVAGTKEKLGFTAVYTADNFNNATINFNSFKKVLFYNFKNDYRDSKSNKADLYDLTNQFKSKIGYDESKIPHPAKKRAFELIRTTNVENSANVAQTIGRVLAYYPELQAEKVLVAYANATDDNLRNELKQQVIKIEAQQSAENNWDVTSLQTIMASLRQVKLEEELTLLNKAVKISAQGQREVMKAMHPGMSETEVQGIHEYVYKKYGSEYEGYPSIVGAGNNGCVLHYIENNKMEVKNELVLMDLGAEYHGYTADVTRTIPANGKFTTAQKQIYDLVYQAQEAGIAAAKVGAPFGASDAAARQVINKGLVNLGVVKTEADARKYFPHGTSHYLGLDVHDAGLYGNLQANMVITVEPGIYIPKGSDCDSKWHGIAVRIEDDILITENGPINLSADAPRTSDAIEKLMQEKSPLDSFVLPKLD